MHFFLFIHIFHFTSCTRLYDSANGLTCYSIPIVALLRTYTLGLTVFKPLLLFQQNRKSKIVNILAYLPRLDIAIRPNGKSGRISGNNTDHFQAAIDANSIAELYSRICSPQLFPSSLSPLSSPRISAVKGDLHRRSRGLVATDVRKYTWAFYIHRLQQNLSYNISHDT
jgi:hypothetical protein